MDPRAVVVGGGVGGLTAAVRLALGGFSVTLLEKEREIGGKASAALVLGRTVATGPTVLTMKHVFEELFAAAGKSLGSYVRLSPIDVLGRHFWSDGTFLDLFSDPRASADAIGRAFGGDDARGFVRFLGDARRIYETVEPLFIRAQRPTMLGALSHARAVGLRAVAGIDGLRTMDRSLRDYFRSPRLWQLFGRYATYCGSSPFEVPATLNLVAYVESLGVHHVEGGIAALAIGLAELARGLGVEVQTARAATRIEVRDGKVVGVQAGGHWPADAVVWNGDVGGLDEAILGKAARGIEGRVRPADRSLSAVTLAGVCAPSGGDLRYHNVFFSDDHAAEFRALFGQRRMAAAPTVYACAEDRLGAAPASDERAMLIVNAPATGDDATAWGDPGEGARCKIRAEATVLSCGVDLRMRSWVTSTPHDFEGRFPGTGGALYGVALRDRLSAFHRAGARTRVRGLYLAGGSVHPGPGVPMASLSGTLAAEAARNDLASLRSPRAAMSGSISTA